MIVFLPGTVEQARVAIVKWLRELELAEAVAARIATRLKVRYQHQNKQDAYGFAAKQIEAMEIKSLPKDKNCPNCGEEML